MLSWLLPSCCFMTFFFFQYKQRALETLFWRQTVTTYSISIHCALTSLSREIAAFLSIIFICCVLTLQLLGNSKSQSKGDMKTMTNVCKVFFLENTPVSQTIFIGRLFAIKKIPAFCLLFLPLLKQQKILLWKVKHTRLLHPNRNQEDVLKLFRNSNFPILL